MLTVLDRLQGEQGVPELLRMDKGPEMIAAALKDWCRFNAARSTSSRARRGQSPYLESFNSRMRDEHCSVEEFTTLTEAQIPTELWRIEYNGLTPKFQHAAVREAVF